ncbi:MAG: anti-sigma factor antagonist, partial [Alphaproteobacteria bacterium]|nr:anti-sigma factor antagonist [Alphaproteobacteria bacterium]
IGPERKLELVGLTPTVAKVFRLTRMDTIFTIHPALPEGLRHAG